jgi:polygalacturonase
VGKFWKPIAVAALLAAVSLGSGTVPQAADAGGDIVPAHLPVLQPSDLGFPAPAPLPELPQGIAPFDPPRLAVHPHGPVIVDMLRTAGPDEIVTFAVEGLDAPGTGFRIFGEGQGEREPLRLHPPLAADAISASLVMPAGSRWGLSLAWPESSTHIGPPVAVNRTEGWWLGPDRAVVGQTVAIHGRNLSQNNGTGSVFVYLETGDHGGRWLTPTEVNPYRVAFEVPQLPLGTYSVWAHNGHGGHFGWSGPFALEVARTTPWARQAGRSISVRDFGATGDGSTDDSAAVAVALTVAGWLAPATVYFPPGEYLVRRALEAPSQVRWLGAGSDASRIRLGVPLEDLEVRSFIYGDGLDAPTFEGIAITAAGMLADGGMSMIRLAGRDISFVGTWLDSWGGETLDLDAEGLTIARSTIIGPGSFLRTSSQIFAEGNLFRMTNDGEAALTSWGGEDISVTDNLLVNADEARPDGNGIGRLFVAQGHFGSLRNLYFAGNRTRNSAPRDCTAVDCNKGEQIIFEFGSSALLENAVAVTADSVTFPRLDTENLPEDIDLIVAGGQGAGQRRRVAGIDGGTVRIDRPWAVIPDPATSRFLLTPITERAVVYRNRFEGRDTHSSHDSNSTAVLVWGSVYDTVVADNDVARMRHGLVVAATAGAAGNSVVAPFFTLVTDNHVRDGNNGLYTGVIFGQDTDPAVTGGIGNVFRGNRIEGMSRAGIVVDTWDTRGGTVSSTVFEKNEIANVPRGFLSGLQILWWARGEPVATPPGGTHISATVLRENRFTRGSAEGGVGFFAANRQDIQSRDNRWEGFVAPSAAREQRR